MLVLASVLVANRTLLGRPEVRDWVETRLSERLGLTVAIGGRISLLPAWPPALALDGFEISTPHGAAPILHGDAERVVLRLSGTELIAKRNARVTRVDARRGKILLDAEPERVVRALFGADGDGTPDSLLDLELEDLVLRRTGSREAPLLEIDQAQTRGGNPVTFFYEGRVRGSALSIRGVLEFAAGGLALPGIALTMGESDLTGDLEIGRRDGRWRIAGKLRSKRLQSHEWLPEREAHGAVLDTPLPLDRLAEIDLELALAVGACELGDVSVRDAKLTIASNKSRLRLGVEDTIVEGGHVNGSLQAEPGATPPRVVLDVEASGLQIIGSLEDEASAQDTPVDIRARLHARGQTPRELIATANGSARVSIGPFELADARLGLFGKSATGLFLAQTSQKKKGTKVNCSVIQMDAANGVCSTKSLLDTEDMTAWGQGTVNLETFAVDVVMKPEPKRPGLGKLKTPIRISGTLPDLEAGVDRTALAIDTGTVALLGFVNPFLMVIPFVNLGVRGNPCEVALKDALAQLPEPQRSPLVRVEDAVRQGAGKVTDTLTR